MVAPIALEAITNINEHVLDDIREDENGPNTPKLADVSRGVCILIMTLGLAAFVYQILVSVLRLLNIELINFRVTIYLGIVRGHLYCSGTIPLLTQLLISCNDRTLYLTLCLP